MKGFTVTWWQGCCCFFLSPTAFLQPCQGGRQPAQQSRSYRKYTPPPSTTSPMVSLFSHPFSSCHGKCYRQLVKVHYTLSSWPETYIPQCSYRTGEECNSLKMMTVHVSWWKQPNVDFPQSHCTIAQWYVNSDHLQKSHMGHSNADTNVIITRNSHTAF